MSLYIEGMSTSYIDYFLCNDDLLKLVMNINIEDSFKIDSNHCLVILDISTNPFSLLKFFDEFRKNLLVLLPNSLL
jgi:hypothetical protein